MLFTIYAKKTRYNDEIVIKKNINGRYFVGVESKGIFKITLICGMKSLAFSAVNTLIQENLKRR